jgi:hypothetical protein
MLSDVEMAGQGAQPGLVAPDGAAAQSVLGELETAELPIDINTLEKPRRGLFGLFARRDAEPEGPEDDSIGDVVEDVPRRGLFGFFARRGDDVENDENTVVASVDANPDATPRRGLFGRSKPVEDAPLPEIAPGTVLPYGEVGVACNITGRALGKKIGSFQQSGNPLVLYDTSSGSLEPRTHFLTGFSDGCARQFTGALVMLGSPVLHERMRYDPLNKGWKYTATDKAYEKIRRRVCKTRGRHLCPGERVAALEAETAFVTVYETFGDNTHWAEILLHQGKVAANSTR